MDFKLLWIFIILNIVNVIIQTVKSIATVKCGPTTAAIVNAVAYGLYTVVVVYTVCDLPLYLKVIIVALCNLAGVFVVKWAEEKSNREKLWKVEVTILAEDANHFHALLTDAGVPHNYIPNIGKWTLFNCYCPTKRQSKAVQENAEMLGGKTFATETKF